MRLSDEKNESVAGHTRPHLEQVLLFEAIIKTKNTLILLAKMKELNLDILCQSIIQEVDIIDEQTALTYMAAEEILLNKETFH